MRCSPNDRLSITQFLASDNTAAFLVGKTVVFVNDGMINLGGTTLNLGTGTTVDGFGNLATVTVPGGVQPANVIGIFPTGGGTYMSGLGAATVTANAGFNAITLGSGDTLQNFIVGNSGTAIAGTNFGTLTVNGSGAIKHQRRGALDLTTGALRPVRDLTRSPPPPRAERMPSS